MPHHKNLVESYSYLVLTHKDWENENLSPVEKKQLMLSTISVIERHILELNQTKKYLCEKLLLLEYNQ